MNYRSRMFPSVFRSVSRWHSTRVLLLATLIVSATGNQMIAQDMPTRQLPGITEKPGTISGSRAFDCRAFCCRRDPIDRQ